MTKSENVAVSNEDELKSIFSNRSGNKEKDLKANTMLEKMGFRDNELFEQEHDNMLYSLMNKDIVIKFLQMVGFSDKDGWTKEKIIEKVDIYFKPEFPVTTYNNYIVGYIDLLCVCKRDSGGSNPHYTIFAIEIKTKIESIGALLRQINTYRNYLKGDKYLRNYYYIVIMPDPTENQKNILNMSGIFLLDIKDVILIS